jgi:hypothetical protein
MDKETGETLKDILQICKICMMMFIELTKKDDISFYYKEHIKEIKELINKVENKLDTIQN